MKYLFSHERNPLSSDVSLPGGSVVNNLSANAGDVRERHGFDLWVGKTPLEEEIATHSVFLPGESHGQRSLVGYSP